MIKGALGPYCEKKWAMRNEDGEQIKGRWFCGWEEQKGAGERKHVREYQSCQEEDKKK